MLTVIIAAISCGPNTGPDTPDTPPAGDNIVAIYGDFTQSLVGITVDEFNDILDEKGFVFDEDDEEYILELEDQNLEVCIMAYQVDNIITCAGALLDAIDYAKLSDSGLTNTAIVNAVKHFGARVTFADVTCNFKIAGFVNEEQEVMNYIYAYNDEMLNEFNKAPGAYDMGLYYWSASDAITESEIMQEVQRLDSPAFSVYAYAIDGSHSMVEIGAFTEMPME